MKVKELIKILKMYGEETDVLIQATPADLCQPVEIGLISLIQASYTERYGLEESKVLLTATYPEY